MGGLHQYATKPVELLSHYPIALFYYNLYYKISYNNIMRKLERQMNFAVSNKGNWSGSNTSVSYHQSENISEVRLHGHLIAWFDHNDKRLALSSCGWQTNTTKSRLNALLHECHYGYTVFQKQYVWYISKPLGKKIYDFFDGIIVNNDGVTSLESYPNVA